jgi:hypothetical protein
MPHTQADLDQARRCVEDGKRQVIAQKRLLNKLSAQGQPTEEAYELLRQMQSALANASAVSAHPEVYRRTQQ